MDKEYVLYCKRSAILKDHPCNLGIYEALQRAEDLRRQGWKVRLVDTSQMTEDERYAVYVRSTTPAMKNKNPIRQVFGSRKQSGFMFGSGVPALLIQAPCRSPKFGLDPESSVCPLVITLCPSCLL